MKLLLSAMKSFVLALACSLMLANTPLIADSIDMSEFQTMEKRESVDLSKYSIVTDNDQKIAASCRVELSVNAEGLFQSRRVAQRRCDDIERFTGLRNTCVVRQFGRNVFQADFEFQGAAIQNTFEDGMDAIMNFLRDNSLMSDSFEFEIKLVSNNNRRC